MNQDILHKCSLNLSLVRFSLKHKHTSFQGMDAPLIGCCLSFMTSSLQSQDRQHLVYLC